MIVFLVSAPLRLLKGRGVLAAMRPGSQTAQPLHSEPVRYGPWSDSRGAVRRRERIAREQDGGRL